MARARTKVRNVRPVETGAWAFSRVLANEFPKLDVRRIDIVAGPAARSSRPSRSATSSSPAPTKPNSRWTARHSRRARQRPASARSKHRSAPRDSRGRAATARRHRRAARRLACRSSASGLRLGRSRDRGRGHRPQFPRSDVEPWSAARRHAGGRLQRPDARPGMRRPGCRSVGPTVKDLKVGDRVCGFARRRPSATHVNVQRTQAVKLPAGMTFEAARDHPGRVPHRLLLAGHAGAAEARRVGADPRRRRRRRHGGDPDRAVARRARHRDRGLAAPSATCCSALGVAARARFPVDHLRRRRPRGSPTAASMWC